MEIKKKAILRTVAGEHMLVPVGDTVFQYNGIFIMTESARLLWDAIVNGKEKEELVSLLLSEYEIDRETAEADVADFLARLAEYGII